MTQLEKYPYLIEKMFKDKETPKVRVEKLIDNSIKEDKDLLNDPSKIEPSKKEKVLRSLKLIKEFKS